MVAERRAIGLMVASAGDRRALASFLGELGYVVVTPAPEAGGAPAALAHCSLIVADEDMAHRFADAILRMKARAGPVILPVLVALPAQSPAAPVLRRGFDEVLRMPIAKSDLLARIETFLRLRRQSEEALRTSEAFSRATLDALDSNICVVDAEGRITLANRAWRRFADANGGQAAGTCEGSDYLRVCRAAAGHSDPEISGAAAGILAVLEGRAATCTVEYPCHAPGERRWFLASATRFGETGAQFIVAIHTNVTARRESERAALAAEQRFRSLVELSSDYFWETDAEHRFTARRAGPALPTDVDFPFPEMLGKRRWELSGILPGSTDWEGHRRLLEARRPFRGFEFARITASGATRHFSISGEPVFGEDGEFRGYRGVGTDITERKREQRLLAMEHAVTRCLAEAEDGPTGLQAMIRVVCEAQGWSCGRYWQLDGTSGVMRARESWSIADTAVENYLASTQALEVAPGQGVMGQVLASGRMTWVTDLASDARAIRPEAVKASGLHGACVVPVAAEGGSLGVLAFMNHAIQQPDQKLLEALNAVGAQLGQFLKRKKSEQVLRESEQRYRSLTALAADWYWETDEQYRLRHVSRESRAIGPHHQAKVIGRRPWEIDYQNRDGPEWAAARTAMQELREFREIEAVARDARGFERRILISGYPIFDAEGRFSGYRGISRDVTERRRTERLHEMEHAVVRCLAENDEPARALDELLALICKARGLAMGRYLEVDERASVLRCVSAWGEPGNERVGEFIQRARGVAFGPGEGAVGRVWQSGQPLWIADVAGDDRIVQAGPAAKAGLNFAFVMPVHSQGKVIGVLSFAGDQMREPDDKVLRTAHAIASQLGNYLARARSQQELRHNEARFRDLTELSSDWYWEQDERLRISYVSAGFEAQTGVAPDRVLGKAPWETPFRPTGPDWEQRRAALQAHLPFRDLEYVCVDGAGTRRHLLISGTPVIDAEGRFTGYRGVGKNITRRRRDEAALQRFRAALDASGDALVIIDPQQFRYVDVNQTFCDLVGYTRDEVLRMTPADLFSASREALERDYALLIAGVDGAPKSVRGAHRRRDGALIPVEASRRALHTEDGWLIVSNARDISATVAHEHALQESNERLQRQARQQTVIATFGEFALKRRKNDELIDKAVAILGEQTDVVAFFEQKGQDMVLRTAVGEVEGASGQQTPLRPDSAAFRVLSGGRSVRVAKEYCQGVPEEWPWASWMRRMGSGVFVPVTHNGHAHGMLALFWRNADAAADEEVRFAEAIAHLLSTALQRERAEEALARHGRRQQLIAELGRRALIATEVDDLFAECMRVSLHEGADAAAIFEFDAGSGRFSLRAAHGIESDEVMGAPLGICGDCPVGTAFEGEEPLLVRDHGAKRCQRVHGGWGAAMRSSVNVRIRGEKAPFGVLSVFSKSPDAFSADDVKYLHAVANMVSSAMQRIHSERRLAFMAQFDPLTALANRSLLQDRLEQTIARSARKNWQVGVLFIDLDRFKLVNDTLGHPSGDQMIREVAGRLSSCVRTGDTVGRISGDEFAVVLADLARPDDAALVAQKIQNALAEPFVLAGTEAFVTASIGIAVFPNDGENADTLLRNADMAMYRAKKSSRNSYRFFTAKMNERALAKMQLDGDLRRAVERREFLLHYQPKVELEGGALIGMEALLRWNHPQRGLVSPAEFIPALENSGLIIPVGEWVIEEASAQVRRWQEAGCIAVPVAINLSAKQFRRRDLDVLVQRILQAAGLPASLLELEITESSLADDPEDAVRQLRNLRAAGLRISVDDFGTGYSSLAYLTRLPLSSLKIDRSFVRGAVESPDSAAIVRAIIDMAHNLQFTVVAEGVETEEQARFLRLHRCEQAQGYLYGRPMSAADMAARLAQAAVAGP